MANDLADFIFTTGNDDASVRDGKIVNRSIISTLNGDDTIEATFTTFAEDGGQFKGAIENFGSINTRPGNDSIIGRNFTGGGNGIFNSQDAEIKTGSGNDSIIGISSVSITNAILNQGTISMGPGDDVVTNIEDDSFIEASDAINDQTGIIKTGLGNDSITFVGGGGTRGNSTFFNRGLITTAAGNDRIDTSAPGFGFPLSPTMNNSGNISMGQGNDTLTGALIDNSGSIKMGSGNDFIEASFVGGGNTNLGPGDDSISISYWPGNSNSQTINGGLDFDQIDFSFGLSDVDIFFGVSDVEINITGNVVEVELTEAFSTWTLRGFELFTFDGQSFTLEELSDL